MAIPFVSPASFTHFSRLFGLSALLFASAASATNPAMVAKVKAGQVKEARASWWGFNPDDATDFVQAAIDSRVPRLILDAMPNSWSVRPLRLVSNQEIVLEKGAKLAAKRGAFQGAGDILLTLSNVTNVTIRGQGGEIRMFRDDYAAAPYDGHVGNRHAIYIRSSAHITIDGLVIRQAGGDAINVNNHGGQYGRPSTDIAIRNCTIRQSSRSGLSIGGVDGLTVEDVSVDGSAGSWPKSGVSIAADHTGHLLRKVVFKNCAIGANENNGIEIRLGGAKAAKPQPVDILFEKCSVRGNGHGFEYFGHGPVGLYARGKIAFAGCTFTDVERSAVKITRKPLGGPVLEFTDCVFENCSAKVKAEPEIKLAMGRDDDPPVDGLHFRNVEFRRAEKFDWISKITGNWMSADVRDISGRIRTVVGTAKKDIQLGSMWCHQNFPPKSRGPTPPRFTFDPAAALVSDLCPGEAVPLSPLITRSSCRYVFYVDAPRQVVFRARYIPITKQRCPKSITVRKVGGDKDVASAYLPDFHEKGDSDGRLAFKIPEAGFYTMSVDPGQNAFQLTKADVPVAFDFNGDARTFRGQETTVYLTPSGGRHAAVFISGYAGLDLRKADNSAAFKHETAVPDWSRYMTQCFGIKNLWSLKIGKPKNGALGDFQLDVVGIHEHLFLTPKKFWYVR